MKSHPVVSFAHAVGVGGAIVAPFPAFAQGPSHFSPKDVGVVLRHAPRHNSEGDA